MSVEVGVVVVFEGDLAALTRTVESIRTQTVKPQELCVAVNAASKEVDAWLQAQKIQKVENFSSVSQAVNKAISHFDSWVNDSEHFVWLLNQDTLADSTSLAELLRAVERAPSVAMVAPKLVDGDSPRYLHEVGVTLSPWGGLFYPAAEQLDQAQFDTTADVLAVSWHAALVRADLWQELGGFDSNFSNPAQPIDFSIRVREKGFRVEVAPAAKVRYFGRKKLLPSEKRTAELQLKAAYSPAWLLPFFWLSLPLWALFRGVYQVATKNLDLVLVELSTSLSAFLKPWQLMFRHRRVSQSARAQNRMLRASWAEVLAQRREVAAPEPTSVADTNSQGSALWWFALLFALNIGFWPTSSASVGGALRPLSDSWLRVFSHAGSSWQTAGFGAPIPADPINWVLASVSAVTFWNPSFSISLLLLASRALAFLGGAKLFGLVTNNKSLARLFALIFAFWPALTSSLLEGNLGATISLVTAPWLLVSLLSLFDLSRTKVEVITQIGVSGLLLAVTLSASPSTGPLWLLVFIFLVAYRVKRSFNIPWVLVPSFVIFAPYLMFVAFGMKHPLLAFVDPLQAGGQKLQLWQAIAGGAAPLSEDFWQLSSGWPLLAVAVCFTLAAALAGLSKNRLVLPLIVFFIIATSYGWLLSNVSASGFGQNASAILGLAGLCLLLILAAGFESVSARPLLATAVCVFVFMPLVATSLLSTGVVKQTSGQVLPAIVQAEWHQGNRLQVLQLEQSPELTARLVTPENLTLDGQSLGYQLSTSARKGSKEVQQLSEIAANLVSASSSNLGSSLRQLGVGFVFAPHARASLSSSLDSSPQLEAAGNTKQGRLWRVTETIGNEGSIAPTQDQLWSITKYIQLGVILVFVLMAIPTRSRFRRQRDSSLDEGEANYVS